MEFYIFKNKEMPWGDYGYTLLVGFAFPNEKDKTQILIERAGPFVPPVYNWATMILVSDTLKRKLEQSGLSGIEYQRTIFRKVVNLDWTNWDLSADDPKIHPIGGEPENYILKGKHNPKIAEKMEGIWCLTFDSKTLIGRSQRNVSNKNELFIIENSWTGNDIFIGEGAGYIFFSTKAKEWFESNAGGFANFEPFNSKVATEDEITIATDYIKPRIIRNNPFAHLEPEDWKTYQQLIQQANKYITKSKNDKTEKSVLSSISKAIESFKKAEQIRPLGKKEKQQLNQLVG